MAIPRETIDLIRDRARIEEIAQRYLPSLKKRGNNYIALCPFHKEKTPSFTVSPDKQIFHCFGCHEGGNIFTFISKIEGLDFVETVKLVGDLVGIKVRDDFDAEKENKFKQLYDINKAAMSQYIKVLGSDAGKTAREYLQRRGVSEQSIKEFGLGYAPESWDYITNFINSQKMQLGQAVELGLVSISSKDNKRHYDKLRARVIFPIIDEHNSVVAFGGRTITDEEPKYLNSPESIIYKKRRVLYGFNIAKNHISELKRAIIVEGYLDVIGCHQGGIKNVVAPLGTALTEDHIKLLSRYATEIILLFDADSAGIKASLRSIEICKTFNIDVKIAVLPQGDPFDFVVKHGPRKLMIAVDEAQKPTDYRISRVISDGINKDKIKMMIELFGIIQELEFDTERNFYLNKISSLLDMPLDSLKIDFKRFIGRNFAAPEQKNNQKFYNNKLDFLARSYREIVLLICNYPDLIEQAIVDFSENDIDDPIAKNIFSRLIADYSANEKISLQKFFDVFTDGNEKEFLKDSLKRDFVSADPQAVYTQIYLNIKLHKIDEKRNKYIDLIKNSAPNADVNKYISEVHILSREREKILPYLNK